jgi:methylated-DNA-[protein]-cysteine S-methyltransferase
MIIQTIVINAPYGAVEITLDEMQVMQLISLPAHKPTKIVGDFAQKVAQDLHAYFSDKNSPLAFPLLQQGTRFQRKVWQQLRNISVGETQTYGEIAKQLNTSPRAVANACRCNPTPIIVPCHRVVAANGLGGYAGKIDGFECEVKEWLLTHESS